MSWTFELADHLNDAPWPANKEELLDFANRIGAPLAVIENLQRLEDDDSVVYDSMGEIWPDCLGYEEYFKSDDEY